MNDIDGDALARVPLCEIESTLCNMQPDSALRGSFETVLVSVAVQLIAGAVPDEMSAAGAFRRGRLLLALLHRHRI